MLRRLAVFAVLFVLLVPPVLAQDGYQRPPDALAALVEAPATPGVSLSPDRATMLLLERSDLPAIADLAAPELRLAGLRIDPRNNGPSRNGYSIGLRLRALDGGAERTVTGLPAGARIDETRWSDDGAHVALSLLYDDRIELWMLDVATTAARRLTDRPLNALGGPTFAWLPGGGGLVAQFVPAGRGAAPTEPTAPGGPVIQENMGAEAPARTYQDLLQNPHDEAVFEHYLTSQLARVGLDGTVTPLGAPALYTDVDVAPGGRHVLVETRRRPYSYLVPYYRFPSRLDVLDLDGRVVHTLAELPLQEAVPTGFGSVPTGVRSAGWRADAPATLVWTEALDEGDARTDADLRDRVFMHAAPFTGALTVLADLALRYGGVWWGEGDLALVNESWWATRARRTYVVRPSAPGEKRLLWDLSTEDRYADPGRPVFRTSDTGASVLHTVDGGRALLLTGQGASPEGNRPFVRRMDLATGETEALFRSDAPYYEAPVDVLDDEGRVLLTRRESVTEPPNYYIRDLAAGTVTAVTDFPHPYPELAGIRKEFVQYERADGVPLTATVYLPPGYDAERDGPLPGFVWAYPREFKSADAAGQVSDSPYRFASLSYWGAVPYVLRGYAVIDDASMPIIGEGDEQPNDRFVEQLVANGAAVVDMGAERGFLDPDRVAVGGHSYGAFMTANLLAHSNIFRAGVARSGAYNRTLTPFGFQAEERTYWEAPEIYYTMSPFMHADDVDEPILLIHGAADNNSGTFPMQSERYYNALKGMGKTARLVMLPYESHGYQARESLLHMMWETDRWLETYVKQAEEREVEVTGPTG